MRKLLLAGAIASVLSAGAAYAQMPASTGPGARMHMAMPTTRAEMQAHVAKMFAMLDANRDGFITKNEAEAMHAKFAAGMEQRASHAGQGEDRSKAFDRMDSNHDGMISRDEFAAAPRPEHMAMRMAGMHMGFAGHMFEMADANKDGRVSLAEAQQLALQHFDRMDLNHDGVISPEEREKAHKMMRSQRHPG